MAHGKWSEVEARGFLEAFNRSGLSMQQFAVERGIVPQRLRWWKYRLARAVEPAEKEELPAVVPVRLKAAAARGEPVTVLLRTGLDRVTGRIVLLENNPDFVRIVKIGEFDCRVAVAHIVKVQQPQSKKA